VGKVPKQFHWLIPNIGKAYQGNGKSRPKVRKVLLTPLWKIPKVRKGKSTLKPKLNDMRKVLAIIFSVFLISCNSHQSKNIYSNINQNYVHLKTKDSALIENFKQAQLLADSIIVTIFNTDSVFTCLNIRYGFLYDNWVKSTSDSLYGKPQKYEFYYNLQQGNDTVFTSACIEIDTIKNILECDYPRFLGLKMLFQNKLKINQSEARTISLKNGLSSNKLIILFKNKKIDNKSLPDVQDSYKFKEFESYWKYMETVKYQFYWNVKNNCDNCPWIIIDAETGKISNKGKVEFKF